MLMPAMVFTFLVKATLEYIQPGLSNLVLTLFSEDVH